MKVEQRNEIQYIQTAWK